MGFILWVIVQYNFIFLLKWFQFGPVGTLLCSSCVFFGKNKHYLYYYYFLKHLFTSRHPILWVPFLYVLPWS